MPPKKVRHSHGHALRLTATHLDKAPSRELVSPEAAFHAIHHPQTGHPYRHEPDVVTGALAKVDQQAILRKHRERHRVVIWDQRTDINGVPAEEVLGNLGHGYQDIYLVFIDGHLTIFQPHVPGVQGFEPLVADDNLERHALRHVEELARSAAVGEIVQKTIEHLNTPPVPDMSHLTEFEDDEVPGLDAGG